MRILFIIFILNFQFAFSQTSRNILIDVTPAFKNIKVKNLYFSELFTIKITNKDTMNLFGKHLIGYGEDFPKSGIFFTTEFAPLHKNMDTNFVEYLDFKVSFSWIEGEGDDAKYYRDKLAPNKTQIIKCSPFRYNGDRGPGNYKITFYVVYLTEPLSYYILEKTLRFTVRK